MLRGALHLHICTYVCVDAECKAWEVPEGKTVEVVIKDEPVETEDAEAAK